MGKCHPDGTTELWSTNVRRYRRIGTFLPARERWYYLMAGRHRHVLHWKPWYGLWEVARYLRGEAGESQVRKSPRMEVYEKMKRRVAKTDGLPAPGVAATSVMWGKLPLIREHLTTTAYEDGGPRSPGYMWIKTTLSTWVVTLFEPDSAARLDVRGPTLDETLQLAEKLLGAENAPWEIDTYLQERQAKKGKKKSA